MMSSDERARLNDTEEALEALRVERVEWRKQEAAYQDEVTRLRDACEATARTGHENATRYAADLAARRGELNAMAMAATADLATERQAGAARVERIRAAIAEGAGDAAQAQALKDAAAVIDGAPHPHGLVLDLACAHLALAEDLRATRARLAALETGLRGLVADHFGAKP
jgi:hypothetical protein